jgi:hypothetical protein
LLEVVFSKAFAGKLVLKAIETPSCFYSMQAIRAKQICEGLRLLAKIKEKKERLD